MRRLAAGSIEAGHRHRLSSGRADAVDRFPELRLEENDVVPVPASPPCVGSVADRERRTSADLDFLELAVRKKAHGAAVRRPERIRGAVRLRQRSCQQRLEGTDPQLSLPARLRRDESELLAVRRDRDRPSTLADEGERAFVRRKHAGANDRGGGQRFPELEDSERHHGGGERRGDDPREPLATPPLGHDRRGQAGLGASFGDPLQLEHDVVRRLPAVFGILLEASLDDAVERGRRHRLHGRDRRRRLAEDRGNHRRLTLSLERRLPRRHLVQKHSQGEDVAARVRLLPLEDLRRHVLEGSDDRSLRGQARVGLRLHHGSAGRDGAGRHRAKLGESEVEELHAGLRHHHVARLQIPMDDAEPVGFVESVGNLDAVAQHLLDRKRTLHDPLGEGRPLQVLHDEVIHSVLVAHVVQGADVRMGELGDRPGLPIETLPQFFVVREVSREYLHGDHAVEPGIPGPVNLSHAAGAERLDDLVRTETCAGGQWHGEPEL